MFRPIVECVPNFSEGRDSRVIEMIASAIENGPDVAVLGRTMDNDHNRSVITFAGAPEGVVDAAVRGVIEAVNHIDLNRHVGVHPRLGAADVIPFVPMEGVSLADCIELAERAAEAIWRIAGVPIYFYEAAAKRPERRRLENVRRGGFEAVREAVQHDLSRRPDVGGPALHPTAGASIVGARKFLIAFNVNLRTQELSIARQIARTIRESSGGMPYVKALGLPLETRGQVQVSINLTDFERTPWHSVVAAVREQARFHGVSISGTEIIGLVPMAAVQQSPDFDFQFENFSPDLIVENRLAAALHKERQTWPGKIRI